MTFPRTALGAYLIALAVVIPDQLSKFWVLNGLKLHLYEPHPVLPPVFNLTLVHNDGVSFGLLRAAGADLARWGLVAFSLLVVVALGVWVRRVEKPLTRLALALVIGGALGNAIDRARLGHVTDFLDFSGAYFPWVFNVADSAITVGVIVLLAEALLTPSPKSAQQKA